jgi:porin
VVLDVDLLQTLQGVASGGRNEVATYLGAAEYTLNVDTQKLGLWPGGFLRVQGVSSFGQNINHASGALIEILHETFDCPAGIGTAAENALGFTESQYW